MIVSLSSIKLPRRSLFFSYIYCHQAFLMGAGPIKISYVIQLSQNLIQLGQNLIQLTRDSIRPAGNYSKFSIGRPQNVSLKEISCIISTCTDDLRGSLFRKNLKWDSLCKNCLERKKNQELK